MPKPPSKSRLPDEVIGRPTASHIVRVVVALFVLFVGLNAFARWYLRHHGTNLGYRMVSAKYDLLDDLAGGEPAEWLILGDSSGAHGIVPAVWSEEMGGGTTHNLAVIANLLVVNDAWMLEEYIERVGVPGNVVLVHAPDVWHRGYNSALIGQIPRPWGIWETRNPRVEMERDHVTKVALSRFLPLYAESSTLRTHLRNAGPPGGLDLQMDEHGWIPARDHSSSALEKDINRAITRLQKSPFTLSSHNQRALKVLGMLADREGFNLYITQSPMAASIAGRADFRKYVSDNQARIRAETGDFERVHTVSGVEVFELEELEACVDHVTPEHAPVYTQRLAQRILRYLEHGNQSDTIYQTEVAPPEGVVLERTTSDDTITLLFGGDTSLARGIDQTISRLDSPADLLKRIHPVVERADLFFLNLASVLLDSDTEKSGKSSTLRGPIRNVEALTAAGVDLVSVANNHLLAFDNQGLRSTLDALDNAGMHYVGLQYSKQPEQPVTIAKVGDQTFGFLAYNNIEEWSDGTKTPWPKPANFSVKAVLADIARAKPQVDHLVVSVHWGSEYSMVVQDHQREAARAFIDAGAELVVGHHPHVPRIVETYNGGLIAYSLGDLVFDKAVPFKKVRTRRRFMLQVDYTGGSRSGVTLHPIHSLDDHIPYLKPDLDVASWMPEPIAPVWRAVDHLEAAEVSRTVGATTSVCAAWTRHRLNNRGHGYLRWLRPRWVCADDQTQPWLTVAETGERSAAIYKRGIWAHPHADGPLTLRFNEVPLGRTIGGIAGIPDWPLKLAGDEAQPPITMRVFVNGEWVHTQTVPYTAGWTHFSVDTTGLTDTMGTVEVQIQGGAPFETGFTFDLMVDAQP